MGKAFQLYSHLQRYRTTSEKTQKWKLLLVIVSSSFIAGLWSLKCFNVVLDKNLKVICCIFGYFFQFSTIQKWGKSAPRGCRTCSHRCTLQKWIVSTPNFKVAGYQQSSVQKTIKKFTTEGIYGNRKKWWTT